MLFVGRGGIFHLPEHSAGNLGTIAAIAEIVLVDSAIIKGADFRGHVFKRPEGLSFYGMTSVALVSKKFAFGADQPAGRQYFTCVVHNQLIKGKIYQEKRRMTTMLIRFMTSPALSISFMAI